MKKTTCFLLLFLIIISQNFAFSCEHDRSKSRIMSFLIKASTPSGTVSDPRAKMNQKTSRKQNRAWQNLMKNYQANKYSDVRNKRQ